MPHRKRLRAEGFDYAQAGWYVVTLCIQHRRHLLGSITDGLNELSPAGAMMQEQFLPLPTHFANVQLDAIVVMPNHLHGIIILEPIDGGPSPVTLSEVVAAYKRITTNACIRGIRASKWPRFDGTLWQRSFHDQIIRVARHLEQ